MSDPERASIKRAYELRGADGQLYGGPITPRMWNRFRQTLKFIPRDVESLLDAGCDRGHWLNFVKSSRPLVRHLGIDVSDERIAEAREFYPDLTLQAGFVEDLSPAPQSYDVVTCMEVLEHVPQWCSVLESLLRIAKKRVVVSVPYREEIRSTICVHCGRMAPIDGHLHSYDESSFPAQAGWRLSLDYIMDYGIGMRLITRLYRSIRPRRAWLVACYDRDSATG